jgi:hypothetical protein
MKDILEIAYKNRGTIVPAFISNPGLGKTSIINEFANEKQVKVVEIITSQIMPTEISGIAMPVNETGRMQIYDFDRLLSLEDGDILFFDELLNGNQMVLNACLTLIESRIMISGKKLPDIMICAAGNPQDACRISPQIKQRFLWVDCSFDDKMFQTYLENKYSIKMPKDLYQEIVECISSEEFDVLCSNYITPRSIDKYFSIGMNHLADLQVIADALPAVKSILCKITNIIEWNKTEKVTEAKWNTFAKEHNIEMSMIEFANSNKDEKLLEAVKGILLDEEQSD